MKKLAVLNLVGLSQRILNEESAPFLNKWVKGKSVRSIEPVLPAVTCSVQSTYLTGKWPSEHGIVANGWYFRDISEVNLWRQSNKLVEGDKVWDMARKQDPSFTVANMFWWYNMYSSADYGVTPRPQYLADGRKLPDCYSQSASLRDRLQSELGTFPLFDFWGPKTTIKSSKWIADASVIVAKEQDPTLLLVYLPHMDYVQQKFGQLDDLTIKDLQELDALCADFIPKLEALGREVMVLSEYGITNVDTPVHINRILREHGLIAVREERGTELLDPGVSKAFAVADHQIAHVYINDPGVKEQVYQILKDSPGIALVLDDAGKKEYHIDHPRAGELVVVSEPNSWFTYYFWEDDTKAPDYARMVDIHKKPGYDPVEMFIDPKQKFIVPKIIWKVLKKKLGFRMVMDVIPLDATLVKGSHGQINLAHEDKAILITEDPNISETVQPTDICQMMLDKIFG